MLKKIMIGFAVLLLVAAGAGYYFFMSLDGRIKLAIEKYGTAATGTAVMLESVHISTSSGTGEIQGLAIANPPGFSTPEAFKMSRIAITLDVHSLMGDGPVVIRELRIEAPQVAFDVINDTRCNLKEITDNIKHYSSEMKSGQEGEHTSATEQDEKDARKLIIEQFYINNGQMRISHNMLKGKIINAKLSDIHMTDLGKDSGGLTPSQIARQVLGTVLDTSMRDAQMNVTGQLLPFSNPFKDGSIGTKLNRLLGK